MCLLIIACALLALLFYAIATQHSNKQWEKPSLLQLHHFHLYATVAVMVAAQRSLNIICNLLFTICNFSFAQLLVYLTFPPSFIHFSRHFLAYPTICIPKWVVVSVFLWPSCSENVIIFYCCCLFMLSVS